MTIWFPPFECLVTFQNCWHSLERYTLVLDVPFASKQCWRWSSGKCQSRQYFGKAAQTLSEYRARCLRRSAVPNSSLDSYPTSLCTPSSILLISVALPLFASPLSTTLLPNAPHSLLSPCSTTLSLPRSPLLLPLFLTLCSQLNS